MWRQRDDFSRMSVFGRRRAIIQGPSECFRCTYTPVRPRPMDQTAARKWLPKPRLYKLVDMFFLIHTSIIGCHSQIMPAPTKPTPLHHMFQWNQYTFLTDPCCSVSEGGSITSSASILATHLERIAFFRKRNIRVLPCVPVLLVACCRMQDM